MLKFSASSQNTSTIIFWISLIFIAVILILGPDDIDVSSTRLTTGKDITYHSAEFKPYINGVIDTALITDSDGTFTCDHPLTLNNTDIINNVIKELNRDIDLQEQPASFAVLNAYKRAYCK